MTQPVRVRRLTEPEGQKLQRIVRRGTTSTVRHRRAMVLLASAGPMLERLAEALDPHLSVGLQPHRKAG